VGNPHTRESLQLVPLFFGWRWAKDGNQHFGPIPS
jgi:hypothetical protein